MDLFKGQVKIADVQNAFTEIVERVNNIIDEYNTQVYVNNIDFTTGKNVLSPLGYTLTIGGFKQFLNAAKGCIIGAKPFKVDSTHIKMTTGLLITDNGIIRLPDDVVTIASNTKSIYFNEESLSYTIDPTSIKICDINTKRSTKSVKDISSIQCEKIDGTYKITSQTKDYTTGSRFITWEGGYYENLDTSKSPKFISAMNGLVASGEYITLLGTPVDSYSENGDRANQVWQPMVYLFIPKGVNNPYEYFQKGNKVSVNKTNQKVLNVKISKDIKQTD